jgi:hypothetical protein
MQDSSLMITPDRQKIGKNLLFSAWAIEIVAALIGLLIAGLTAVSTRQDILDIEGGTSLQAGDWLTVFVGALPFVMVAVVELTKIPLATASYIANSATWRTIFVSGLLILMFITAETMMNGFERSFNSRTYILEGERKNLAVVEENIENRQSEISLLNQLTRESIEESHSNAIGQLSKERDETLKSLQLEEASIIESFSSPTAGTIKSQLDDVDKRISSLRERNMEIRAQAGRRRDTDLTRTQSRFQESLATLDSELAALLVERENISSRFQNARKSSGRMRSSDRDQMNELLDTNDRKQQAKKEERAQLIERREQALNALRTEATENIQEAEARLDRMLAPLEEEKRNLNAQLQQISRNEQGSLSTLLNPVRQRRSAVMASFEQRSERLGEDYDHDLGRLASKVAQIDTLESEISTLNGERTEIREKINVAARNNQIYRVAQFFFDRDTPSDVQRDEIRIVMLVWFGSLAAIVAWTGTLLAFTSLVVRYGGEKEKSDRKPSVALENARLQGWKAWAKFWRSIRFWIVNRQYRTTRTREIVREVVKEVPVEKVTIKEVEKQIPVDKVVFKEVPREVVRKKMVYVPLYTNDPSLLTTQKGEFDATE